MIEKCQCCGRSPRMSADGWSATFDLPACAVSVRALLWCPACSDVATGSRTVAGATRPDPKEWAEVIRRRTEATAKKANLDAAPVTPERRSSPVESATAPTTSERAESPSIGAIGGPSARATRRGMGRHRGRDRGTRKPRVTAAARSSLLSWLRLTTGSGDLQTTADLALLSDMEERAAAGELGRLARQGIVEPHGDRWLMVAEPEPEGVAA